VGATAVRKNVGGGREFQRKQDPGGESEPDLTALDLSGLAVGDCLEEPPWPERRRPNTAPHSIASAT